MALVAVFQRQETFANARSWKDVLSKDDIEQSLRGSSDNRIQQQFRPEKLSIKTEEDPFYFPSSNVDKANKHRTDDTELNVRGAEASTSNSPTPIANITSSEGDHSKRPPHDGGAPIQAYKKDARSTSSSNNVFLRQSVSSIAEKRDINSYRTSRTFVPPTDTPASIVSPIETANLDSGKREANFATEFSAQEATMYMYPEDSVGPGQSPGWDYFNYDTSEDSWYGPGYPVLISGDKGNNDLVVEYANNAWIDYQPPPRIPPSDAMAIANGMTSDDGYKDYFYWDEFGPKGLGFGPWLDTLRNLRESPNQCGNVGTQSPIDVRPNGVACLEHHQIRSRKGDFRVFGTKNNLDLYILPNKLRVGVRRRPCKQIDNPVCSEPDPPHADFPHGWPGFADVLHVDFKFPAEHRINGEIFDGEMQIYHLHPGRRRLPVVTVLMKVEEGENDTTEENHGHNEYLQEVIDGFQYEYDANRAKCAKTALENENRRLQVKRQKMEEGVDGAKHRRFYAERNSQSVAEGDGTSKYNNEDKPSRGNNWKNDIDDFHSMDRLMNATFGGEREQLELFASLMQHNSSFTLDKDNHRRRLAAVWNPHHESLVPSIYFYGYEGSLTEPPCSEIVSWFVIDKPMMISRTQLEHMKFLLFTNVDRTTCESTSVHYKGSVARPIQETGANRQIWHCTPNEFLPD